MKLETENNNMSKEKNVETVQVDLNGFEDNTNPVAVPGKIAKAAKKSKVNIPEKSEPVVENEKKQVKKKATPKNIKEPADETVLKKKAAGKKISDDAKIKTEDKAAEVPAKEAKKQAKKKTATSVKKESKKKDAPKKAAIKKSIAAKEKVETIIKITFIVRFHTKFGQSLYITGNHKIFGDNKTDQALPMHYLNEELWTATVELDKNAIPAGGITYNYLLKNEDSSLSFDWGNDKVLTQSTFSSEETLIIDAWNFAGYFENVFYTEPFKNVLLRNNFTDVKTPAVKSFTHIFKVKAPLLQKGQTVCLIGNNKEMGEWNDENVVVMSREQSGDFYSAKINLSKTAFPVYYKYGIYDIEQKKLLQYEQGDNRVLYDAFVKTKKTIVNDGFIILPVTAWKGAGTAIPVFSLRSANSCGVGEFTDIKLLVDWAKTTGLKLVQILPVNDTTATHTWTDSYPYAAISAFALHPMYLNLEKAAGVKNKNITDATREEKQRLNKLAELDYEAVNDLKWKIIRELYPLQKEEIFASADYQQFFELNKHWLVPYAAFCYFRDKYNSADFNQWASHKNYNAEEVAALLQPSSETFDALAIYLFVQYHLHLQLKEATQYAHDNGIIMKGDIPIGVYRYGADAWQQPQLYHMDVQAGAPPDDFAVTGQNWGFPTYNWQKMQEDGFAWWKQRFEQMSYYFDAFRIDHILGFFRIWSIPTHSVEGIMGRFEPAIPVHINEFKQNNIWFEYNRYCQPFITERLLNEMFGDQKDHVKYSFLNYDGFEKYHMKPEYATQKQVENYFTWQQDNEHNRWLKRQLFSLISNVILFEEEGSQGKQFHFRFGMNTTDSFKNLDAGTQHQLNELYVNYFFRRQDNFWMQQAMQKLPALKRETNMLVCGEDLGLVPGCVPEVMRQLCILSLEIQRMPKDPKREFFHPADAPYLSVITPSTHDMSTIRGWWEEDRNRTQRFYNDDLGQWGNAPYFCDAWVNKAIVVQHLYSPAMWCIFQLQDILGINRKIRRPDPHEERINVPANPKHYWRYRMHLTLEDLIKEEAFNKEVAAFIKESGRA